MKIEKFIAICILLWVISIPFWLVGCGPAKQPGLGGDQGRAFYSYRGVVLRLYDNLSKTGTPQELEWWREWIRELADKAYAIPGLRHQGAVINVYKDNNQVLWRNTLVSVLGIPQMHIYTPPYIINGIPYASIRGYVYKKEIHISQGAKQTCNGAAAHWLTHRALEDQANHHDDAHRLHNWGKWNREFQLIAATLQARR